MTTAHPYLTVNEAADLMRCEKKKVRQLLRDGVLPGRRVGRTWRIPRHQLEAWMEQPGR